MISSKISHWKLSRHKNTFFWYLKKTFWERSIIKKKKRKKKRDQVSSGILS